MNPNAVALTKRPDQLCVLCDLVRLEPLFDLVDHDEQLLVTLKSLAAPDRGQELRER